MGLKVDPDIDKQERMKFTSLDIEDDLKKSTGDLCTFQRLLCCGLVCIIAGLVLGGASLGIGLYLLNKSAPTVINVTSPITPVTTKLPVITTEGTDATTEPSSASTIPSTELSPITSELSTPNTTIKLTTPKVVPMTTTPEVVTTTTTPEAVTTATKSPSTTDKTDVTTSYSKPECLSDQFTCRSGECIGQGQVCDGQQHCHDNTDEYNCTECGGFSCTDGLCLPNPYSRCNGVFDCPDISDELGCRRRPRYYLCNNGVQIEEDKVCDGLDDCGDNSDELGCRCFNGRFQCPDRKCILRQWVCDGYPDCINGTDESFCDKCNHDQYTCTDYKCINQSAVCNGHIDCIDGKDEQSCITVGVEGDLEDLKMVFEGQEYYVCSDNWQLDVGEHICRHQGFDEVSKAGFTLTSDKRKMLTVSKDDIKVTSKESVLKKFTISEACFSGRIVRLACRNTGCGERKVSFLQQFIAGGQVVPHGKWPWVVSISYLGQETCGGALISADWVVTAGHCIKSPDRHDYTDSPFDLKVRLGSTDRKKGTTVRVRKVKLHPGLSKTINGVIKNDVALLRLEHPVKYTSMIQPICYHSDAILTKTSFCYLAGWGFLSWRQYQPVQQLRETKMQLWSNDRCSSNTVTGETIVDTNTTICGGYFTGIPTGCEGDSGGPLMCFSTRGRWFLAGVMSTGSGHCGRLAPGILANRFTRISHYIPWIDDIVLNT